jgi:hypothetical protein
MFEELKLKVRPKLLIVNRELAGLSKIIRDFDDKNSEDCKPVFTKKVGFYLDGLQFDSGKVLDGLEDEIAGAKRES